MNIKEIFKKLISLPCGENETVEFKEAETKFEFNKLGKYFSALSNEANLNKSEFAWLVFGVADKNKTVVGTNFKNNEQKLQQLKSDIALHTSNKITFTNIHTLHIEDKRVLMFQIPPAPKGIPTAWQGHYYGRDGESLVPLKLSEIETIRKQTFNSDWSSYICEDATLNDLDSSAIAFAREKYQEKNPSLSDLIQKWDDVTFLNKARLTIGGKITNTALILLGKAEAEIKLKPAIAQISWVLRDNDNNMIDYEHFHPPFILTSLKVHNKIRNLKYRYLPEGFIFPEELNKYDDYVIREALHNCIAHQDYSLSGKINVVEKPDELIFSNVGNFFLQLPINEVITLQTPPEIYRNPFLAKAMVEVKMIDTIGSGILRMFQNQRKRFFPLPEYDLSNPDKVQVKIFGKILDPNYTKLLMTHTNLPLSIIALLDSVQKKQAISDEAIKLLRKLKLIEGRKPNIFISSQVAKASDKKGEYIKNKGFDNKHYEELILEYLKKFSSASRIDINNLILDKLPDILDEKQKEVKVKNLLYIMSKKYLIYCSSKGPNAKWALTSSLKDNK
ncbi:putative DNA binding domain-containing protein [bacterium]|nr:putative DNA binding domain-containing protein [bacterium]